MILFLWKILIYHCILLCWIFPKWHIKKLYYLCPLPQFLLLTNHWLLIPWVCFFTPIFLFLMVWWFRVRWEKGVGHDPGIQSFDWRVQGKAKHSTYQVPKIYTILVVSWPIHLINWHEPLATIVIFSVFVNLAILRNSKMCLVLTWSYRYFLKEEYSVYLGYLLIFKGISFV